MSHKEKGRGGGRDAGGRRGWEVKESRGGERERAQTLGRNNAVAPGSIVRSFARFRHGIIAETVGCFR